MKIKDLIQEAKSVAKEKEISDDVKTGTVGAALITKTGKLYKGKSVSTSCGMGNCAEHSAIAAMLTNDESEIEIIASIRDDGTIYPPCGKCREYIYQINPKNLKTKFIISKNKTVTLKELLPKRWQEV